MHERVEIRMTGEGFLFRWLGGPYIEISTRANGTPGIPFDVINVWDYETDKARIPFTPAAMLEEVSEWLSSQAES